MSITAIYTFSNPSITGGSITASNKASESEIKAAILAELAVRKAAAQGSVTALEAAESGMNG